jgi:hypothetical protein
MVPVMNPALPHARKTIASAISSGRAHALHGRPAQDV